MSRPARIALWIGGGLLAVILVLGIAGVLVLRSDWFRAQVRNRIVAEIAKATGGSTEIRAFYFDWGSLTARVEGLVIHGTEPPGSPPLFRAQSVSVGLKIVSLLQRKVNIESLEVQQPNVHLIVFEDGRTNVPEPKVKRPRDRSAMETILDLAIRRFRIENGLVEVAERKIPLNARGENLNALFRYDFIGPRYEGNVSIQPLLVSWPDNQPLPVNLDVKLGLEKNRVNVQNAVLESGKSRVELSGTLDDLSNPHGSVEYDARLPLEDLGRTLRLKSRQAGTIKVGGSGTFTSAPDFSLKGNVNGSGISYEQGTFAVRNGQAVAALALTPEHVSLTGARLSASLKMTSARGAEFERVDSRINRVALNFKTRNVVLDGLQVAALGGSFSGRGDLSGFNRYRLAGDLSGFELSRLMAQFGGRSSPWGAVISGPVNLQGSLKARGGALQASARLNIAPNGRGQPVSGNIVADYDQRRDILDLGRSTLSLPHTTIAFSGAIGRQMHVRLDSRNLEDLLPAIALASNGSAPALPVKLEKGVAVFDGDVTGPVSDPRVVGHVSANNLVYGEERFDSVNADVNLAQSQAAVRNGSLARGPMRADFAGSVGLRNWKALDASPVSAKASLRNANIVDVLALAGQKDVPVSGTLAASAEVSGTMGDPDIRADLTATRGSLRGEPFDRLAVRVASAGPSVTLTSGELNAGTKQITFSGNYRHPVGDFLQGRVEVQMASNAMSLQDIQLLQQQRPDARGTVQLKASGSGTVTKRAGQIEFKVSNVVADVQARKLEINQKVMGDLHLTANTQGDNLTARLDSDFANSVIRGKATWRLAGDYPGSGQLSFTKLEFAELRDWVSPRRSAAGLDFTGSADGTLTFSGPALKPDAWRAALEVPRLQITPQAPGSPQGATGIPIRNSGPIRVSMEKSVIRIEQARLVASGTDLTFGGTIAVKQTNPLDVKVDGRADLDIVETFNRDLVASGFVDASATIRGSFQQPLINGRLALRNASLNMVDLPNGLSKVNGVVLFNGNRATIQEFAGETGGGTISLSGFVGYGTGPLVFRLQAVAKNVRVRYPEGVSTVANADINLTGTADSSVLAGTVTILRTGFNPRSDFSSILASSAEPVRTPAAKTGLLANMHFDVQIETAPDISFQSALAQDLQAEANLRLRGTAANPALLGRVTITQGELIFFGTKFTINQGSVGFYNPTKIEPILNVDLETRARGVDVILTVTGPLSKLNVSPRSDPPLPFSDILALLATGRAPTSDPTLAARQSSQPQSWQQMGATALVGQAIANPVAGRLQRFFGVTKLKIDPTVTGVENNPQARFTIEQQVSRNLTFTYIQNIAASSSQVVRVEWAWSREWSVIAVREENGLFGIDFLYKKRF
jgi:translocation and assembly module TamB